MTRRNYDATWMPSMAQLESWHLLVRRNNLHFTTTPPLSCSAATWRLTAAVFVRGPHSIKLFANIQFDAQTKFKWRMLAACWENWNRNRRQLTQNSTLEKPDLSDGGSSRAALPYWWPRELSSLAWACQDINIASHHNITIRALFNSEIRESYRKWKVRQENKDSPKLTNLKYLWRKICVTRIVSV